MSGYQQTINRSVTLSGAGLFSGKPVVLRLRPSSVGTGIRFVRVDLPSSPSVRADAASIVNDTRRVLLEDGEAVVEGIEHLMASLAGLGVDNLTVELDGREMPAGDGSALKFVELVTGAGIVKQDAQRRCFTGKDSLVVSDGHASIAVIPDRETLTLTYLLDFNGYCLNDKYTVDITVDTFCDQIAPARTFGLDSNVAIFKELGIGKGITDDNTFIVQRNGNFTKPLSGSPATLRFPDECIRHKVLDLLGDLSLSNVALNGHIIAKRSGHFLNVRMARKIADVCRSG